MKNKLNIVLGTILLMLTNVFSAFGQTLDITLRNEAGSPGYQTVVVEGTAVGGDFNGGGLDDWPSGQRITLRMSQTGDFPATGLGVTGSPDIINVNPNLFFTASPFTAGFGTGGEDISLEPNDLGDPNDGYQYILWTTTGNNNNVPLFNGVTVDLLSFEVPDTWVCPTCIEVVTTTPVFPTFPANETTFAVSSLGVVLGSTSSGGLPIELLSFNAGLIENNTVQLDWATASEQNNDFFTIEKSLDGQNWSFVTEVDGAGNSTEELNYQAFDPRPYAGVSYYRLKQTDFDGAFTYSDIRSVEVNKGREISVRPNPTDGVLTIAGSGAELSSITLLNSFGKHIESYNNELDNAPSEVKIDLTNLSSGVYFLRTATQTKKVVKQ